MTIERRLDRSVKSLVDTSEPGEDCRCEIVVDLLTILFCGTLVDKRNKDVKLINIRDFGGESRK